MSSNPTGTMHQEQPSLDDCFRVLGHEQRRIVIDVLVDQSRISLDELADEIASRSPRAISRGEIEVSLVHHHLPMLAEIGAIEQDGEWVMSNPPVFGWLNRINLMTLQVDDAYKALAHPERRQLLFALADQNPQRDRSLDYLVDVPYDSSETIENIQVKMHHMHLPRLEAAGIIERNDVDREISRGSNFDEIRPLLQVINQATNGVRATDGL